MCLHWCAEVTKNWKRSCIPSLWQMKRQTNLPSWGHFVAKWLTQSAKLMQWVQAVTVEVLWWCITVSVTPYLSSVEILSPIDHFVQTGWFRIMKFLSRKTWAFEDLNLLLCLWLYHGYRNLLCALSQVYVTCLQHFLREYSVTVWTTPICLDLNPE